MSKTIEIGVSMKILTQSLNSKATSTIIKFYAQRGQEVIMCKKSYFKGLISGILVVFLTANIVFAASNTSIKVAFDNIKMVFDGVQKTPSAGTKPMTYNGKIYVPLDFAAKSMGKNYTYDAKNKTAYIGLSKTEVSKDNVVKTSDGYAQLSFPKEWKSTTSPNPETKLFCTDGKSGIAIIHDNKSIFSDDMTIEDYCSLVTENMTGRIDNPVTTEAKSVKINNYPALQFELQGELQKIKFKYLVSVVETDGGYYQLLAYSNQSDYSKFKNNYIKIFNTFKEIKK